MRFDLNQTNAQSFVLSLPDEEGRTRVLGFEYITDLGGAVEIIHDPHLLILESAAADGGRLTRLDWNLPHGRLATGAPAAVSGLFVDARIPLGLRHGLPVEGRATLRLLDAESLQVEGFIPRLTCGARVAQVAVEQSGDRGAASLGSLAVHDLRTEVAGFQLHVSAGSVGDVEATWQQGNLDLRVGAASVDKIQATGRDVEVCIERLALAGPVTVRDGQIRIGALTIDEITIAIDQLSATSDGGEAAKEAAAGGNMQLPLDLRLLDLISGKLEIDAAVDASVPIIGRRKATHAFRVPIDRGTFDFKRLERGLSALEDAVIDFEVKGSRLVIERDIPIIRMRKDLVEWQLDQEELALARQRRVRLRTLPRYRLVSPNGGDFDLRSLRLDPIDIDLTVGSSACLPAATAAGPDADADANPRAATATDAPAELAQAGVATAEAPLLDGIVPRLAMSSLEIAGCVSHPDKPGLLTVTVHQLATALRGLALDSMELDVGDLSVEAIGPAQITFSGLRPDALSVTIRGVRLRDVTIRQRARGEDAPRSGQRSDDQ